MSNGPRRTFVWASRGLTDATANDVTYEEAITAAEAPDHERYDIVQSQVRLVVAGRANTGRVVAVSCEKNASFSPVFWIVGARPLTAKETEVWKELVDAREDS